MSDIYRGVVVGATCVLFSFGCGGPGSSDGSDSGVGGGGSDQLSSAGGGGGAAGGGAAGDAGTNSQNLILNGSFESPIVSKNSFQRVQPTSWSWEGSFGGIINGNGGNPSAWPLPEDGAQVGDIGNEMSIFVLSQQFQVASQATYVLSWYDSSGHSASLNSSPYSMAILSDAGLSLAGLACSAYHTAFGEWARRSLEVPLSPGQYTLRFESGGVAYGLDSLIDNVSLVQKSP